MFKQITTISGAIMVGLTGCGDKANSIASLKHDLGGTDTLFAYAAEPATQTRQGDKIHKGLYGVETKSPRTPYICVWRNTNYAQMSDKNAVPSEIFLTCAFGTTDWEPPASLIEAATQQMQRDYSTIRVRWVSNGAGYDLTRFEVELRQRGVEKSFRSINFDREIDEVKFSQSDVKFPVTANDPFEFKFSVALPRRFNKGERASAPIANMTIEGLASPMPDWIMY